MSSAEQTISVAARIRLVGRVGWKMWMPLSVFAASVLVTCTFLAMLPHRFRADEGSDYANLYAPVARNVLAGRGFTSASGAFAVVYPPGYSLILAATFATASFVAVSDHFALLVLSVLAAALVSLLTFVLANMMWGVRAAIVSAALWITYPLALWLAKQPNSELPFMVLLYGALVLLWYALTRRVSLPIFFACGCLLGLAMLVRPVAIGLPFVTCSIVWLTPRLANARSKSLIVTVLLMGTLIPVLPWEALAYTKTQQVIPLSVNGPRSVRDGLTYGVLTKGYRKEGLVSGDVAAVMQHIAKESSDDSLREIAAAAMQQTFAHPVVMAKLIASKVARSWYGTDSGRLESPVLFLQLGYLAVIGWSTQRLWRAGLNQRAFVLATGLVTFYFWGMTILVLSTFRYMLPVMPLLFILAGLAIADRISARKPIPVPANH